MYFNHKNNMNIDYDFDDDFEEESSIKEFFNKFKIPIIIILSLIIISIIIFIIKNNKNNYEENIMYFLELEGDTNITLYKDSKFVEPGYIAYDNKGNNLSNEVIINNNLDTSNIGTYVITYLFHDVFKERKISIVENPTGATYIHLLGDSIIYLKLNETYKEPGYLVTDTVDSNLKNKVKILNNINSKEPGIYKVTYTVTNSSGVTSSTTRKVIVTDGDTSLSLDNLEPTNKEVGINIHIVDNYFDYLLLPNNEKITSKDYTYKVSKNGTYKFTIYTKKGSHSEETIKVTNINKTKPTGSCTGYIKNGKSYITVKANDDIGISKYLVNGISTTSNNITINKELETANITIYDEAGNTNIVSCNIEKTEVDLTKKQPLEIHFIASGHYDDAILIRSEDKTILIDGGRYDCYKKVVPYLKTIGVTNIDLMIGSHLDGDHIQAEAEILNNFNVDKVYYPDDIFTCRKAGTCPDDSRDYIVDALKKYNKTPIIASPGTTITLNDITIYFLAPYKLLSSKDMKNSENENSYIFILKYGDNTFMFTGDADSELKDTQIQNYANKLGISFNVDLLKHPHHGNATLNDKILSSINPKYIIIPNYNASKYPNEDNLKRLKKYSKVYRQSDSKTGNIVVLSNGKEITIKNDTKPEDYQR